LTTIAAKTKFRDLTPEAKQKRYDYAKTRRHKLNAAMREAGIIGAPRPKMDPEERKAKRKSYNKNYRHTITAQAKAYREMMAQEGTGTKKLGRGRR
jgi:hypothetical protein